VTAYLTTTLGPETGLTNLVSTSTVLVSAGPLTSSSYNLLSGLNLSPGNCYLTVSEPWGVGWLSSSSPSLYQTSGFSYLGAFSANIPVGVVDSYAPASNFYPIPGSYSPASYGLLFSVSGDPSTESRISAAPEPSAIGLLALGSAASILVGIGRKHCLVARNV
jgi:hypothetical protein